MDEVHSKPKVCESVKDATNIIIKKQSLLLSFLRGHVIRFNWTLITIHVYKRSVPKKVRDRLYKLSYICDKFRKKGYALVGTKEYTNDGYPHYHLLLKYPIKDKSGKVLKQPSLPSIKYTKLWSRPLATPDMTYSFEIELLEHGRNIEYNTYQLKTPMAHVITRDGLEAVDLGFKHRFMKYGLTRYLLYILKYSKLELWKDYYLTL